MDMRRMRASLLAVAAALMVCGAVADAVVMVPALHGDLVEIGVRPSVLGGTMIRLYAGALALWGFALIVGLSAIQEMRGSAAAALPLAVIAVVEIASGVIAFSASHNPHHLGPIVGGVLVVAALVPRAPRDR